MLHNRGSDASPEALPLGACGGGGVDPEPLPATIAVGPIGREEVTP